jgi:DNA-binding MarR family transcriptional regulator
MKKNNELAIELQNVISQLRRANVSKFSFSKLKGAERHILLLISDLKKGQPVSISEIANKIGVTLAAVTHQINTLEEQGMIKRLSDNEDRRIVLIELTKNGNEQVSKLKNEFAKKIQLLVEFLGENDTKELVRLIGKISEFRGLTK